MVELVLMWAVCILPAAMIVAMLHDIPGRDDKDLREYSPSNSPRVPSDKTLASRYQSVRFDNLVIKSGGNTPYTEIDSVIVSPYGIFCIEEKAHVGYIFGSKDKEYWTQCKYTERVKLYNPLRQNYKHVQALSSLLSGQLKAPVHSYVLFSRAKIVQVDSSDVFYDRQTLQDKINDHSRQIYTLAEYEAILKTLAIASSKSKALLPGHISEVNAFLKHRAAI